MKNNTENIAELSEYLGLKKLAQQYQQYIQQAHEKQLGFQEFLQVILQEESIRKRECNIRYRIEKSRLPCPYKLLDDFDFSFQPTLRKSLIMDLATMDFIKNKESLLMIGLNGTGKSHLAQALGMIACEKGYKVSHSATLLRAQSKLPA